MKLIPNLSPSSISHSPPPFSREKREVAGETVANQNKSETAMEGISATMYNGLKGYWKRRSYVKLNGSSRVRRRRVELGTSRRKRFWRIKMKAKVRIKSPKRLFVWLRDAYVKMMMGLANSRIVSSGYGVGVANQGIAALVKRPMKEYDQKMIVEIYKSLVIGQGQFVAREALLCHRLSTLGSPVVDEAVSSDGYLHGSRRCLIGGEELRPFGDTQLG
ncbi:uncharacterized protein LOC120158430 [Hibiscus syriacus]|uniref:uncharacterized protein LOC120158430 n=1 Tax=Hibiscus syriacus TaxID=106335 RepID=UPI001921ABEF|nr:uncharacterized protein LOC120158430 [Hibiscus syriacus]